MRTARDEDASRKGNGSSAITRIDYARRIRLFHETPSRFSSLSPARAQPATRVRFLAGREFFFIPLPATFRVRESCESQLISSPRVLAAAINQAMEFQFGATSRGHAENSHYETRVVNQ